MAIHAFQAEQRVRFDAHRAVQREAFHAEMDERFRALSAPIQGAPSSFGQACRPSVQAVSSVSHHSAGVSHHSAGDASESADSALS